MPRRATKPFDKRLFVAPRILEAINQIILEVGDEPVTELELLQAYYAVQMARRPNRHAKEAIRTDG